MSPHDSPTSQDLTQLLDRVRPRIARLFERHRVSEPEAEALVGEALVGLAYRWKRVRDRERWLLDEIARRVRERKGRASKEP
jgi:hypothetical protein